jgi:hypothetical protein
MRRLLVITVLTASLLIGFVYAQTSPIAGDSTDGRLESLPIKGQGTVRTRTLAHFDFPNNHMVEFHLIEDRDRSIGIFESGQSGGQFLTHIRELNGASPSTIWHALNTNGSQIPSELRDLYGAPDTRQSAGWLGKDWLNPSNPIAAGVCSNTWFNTFAGTEAAFPDADEHFQRKDKWGDSSGSYGGYYQYASSVEIWHGGICLQQEIQVEPYAPPGTAWKLWYYMPEDYWLAHLVTPVYTVLPGHAGHWYWYKCGSCGERLWIQVAAPNDGLLIQFDMGMDWTH